MAINNLADIITQAESVIRKDSFAPTVNNFNRESLFSTKGMENNPRPSTYLPNVTLHRLILNELPENNRHDFQIKSLAASADTNCIERLVSIVDEHHKSKDEAINPACLNKVAPDLFHLDGFTSFGENILTLPNGIRSKRFSVMAVFLVDAINTGKKLIIFSGYTDRSEYSMSLAANSSSNAKAALQALDMSTIIYWVDRTEVLLNNGVASQIKVAEFLYDIPDHVKCEDLYLIGDSRPVIPAEWFRRGLVISDSTRTPVYSLGDIISPLYHRDTMELLLSNADLVNRACTRDGIKLFGSGIGKSLIRPVDVLTSALERNIGGIGASGSGRSYNEEVKLSAVENNLQPFWLQQTLTSVRLAANGGGRYGNKIRTGFNSGYENLNDDVNLLINAHETASSAQPSIGACPVLTKLRNTVNVDFNSTSGRYGRMESSPQTSVMLGSLADVWRNEFQGLNCSGMDTVEVLLIDPRFGGYDASYDDYSGFGGYDETSIVAYEITTVIPAYMKNEAVEILHFMVNSPERGYGLPIINILEVTPFYPELDIAGIKQRLSKDLRTYLVDGILQRKLEKNEIGTYCFTVIATLMKDCVLRLSLNGEPFTNFKAPMFCSNKYSPMVVENENATTSISSVIETISYNII